MSQLRPKSYKRDLTKSQSSQILSDDNLNIKKQNPTNPSDRSKFTKLQRFDSRKELGKQDLSFAETRVPSTQLPSEEVDFDTVDFSRQQSRSTTRPQSTQQNHNVQSYSLLPPDLQSGITIVNKFRTQDSLFKHSDQLIDVESDIQSQFQQIKTGNEAVAFFARNSKNNPIKFVVCEKKFSERKPVGLWQNRPYDLEVPPHGMEEKYKPVDDQFIINMHGIIIYRRDDRRRDKQYTEFLTLAEWMRQAITFDSVSDINFFKHYVRRKVLLTLHNKVRRKMYQVKRRALINNLFLTKPCQAPTLMQIKAEIATFQIEDFFQVHSDANDQEHFIQDFKSGVLKKLDLLNQTQDTDLVRKIRKHLLDLCRNVKKRLQLDKADAEKSKSKPLVHLAQEKKLNRIILAFAKEDDHVLQNFLKMVQNMLRGRLQDTYIQLFGNFVHEIQGQIQNQNDKKSATGQEKQFKTIIELNHDSKEVNFNPDWSQFQNELELLIKDPIHNKLNKFKRLLDETIRTDFTTQVSFGSKDDQEMPNKDFKTLYDIFCVDEKFKGLQRLLIQLVKEDWAAGEKGKDNSGQDNANKYNELMKINHEVISFKERKLEELKNQGKTIAVTFQGHDYNSAEAIAAKVKFVEEVNEYATKYDKQKKRLEELKKCKQGILDFDMTEKNTSLGSDIKRFSETLKDAVREHKASLKDTLTHILMEDLEEMERMKEEDQPVLLEDETTLDKEQEKLLMDKFYKCQAKIQSQVSSKDKNNRIEFLKRIKNLISDFGDPSAAQLDTNNINKLRTNVMALDVAFSDKKFFVDNLVNNEITERQRVIQGNEIDKMKDDHGSKVSFETFDISRNQKYYGDKLDELVAFRNYMDSYKNLLGREVNKEIEWRILNEFIKKLEGLKEFQQDLQKLRYQQQQMQEKLPINQLSKISGHTQTPNPNQPLQEFKEVMLTLKQNSKKFIDSFKSGHNKLDILVKYEERLDTIITRELPVLENLARVELRKHHFETIFGWLNFNILSEEVRFNELLDKNILSYSSRISKTLNQAISQKKLRESTDRLINKWKVFEQVIEDDEFFSNLDEVLNEVDYDLDKIDKDIMNDQEVEIVRVEVTTLKADLEHQKALSHTIARFQTQFKQSSDLFNIDLVLKVFKDDDREKRTIGRKFTEMKKSIGAQRNVQKVYDKLVKADAKPSIANIEDYTEILSKINFRINSHLEELRMNKIQKRLHRQVISEFKIRDLPVILGKCIVQLDSEQEDKNEQPDTFSDQDDELFDQQRATIEERLDKMGIYNKFIKVWQYKEFNDALVPPEGICKKEEKISRERLDIWQLGVLTIDLFTRGSVLEYIKMLKENGDEKSINSYQSEIAKADDPISKLRDLLDQIAIKGGANLSERVNDVKVELRMDASWKTKLNPFIKNCMRDDKYDRYSIDEVQSSNLIKDI